jgi:hypothetical protein
MDEECLACVSQLDDGYVPQLGTRQIELSPRQKHAPPTPSPLAMSLSTMFLLVSLAAAVFALIAAHPGLAVPVCILLVPSLSRATRVVTHRKQRGIAVTSWEKVVLLASNFIALAVAITVIMVAAFGTFCGVGAGMIGVFSPVRNTLLGMALVVFTIGATLAVVLPLTRAVNNWMVRRDRRDFGDK